MALHQERKGAILVIASVCLVMLTVLFAFAVDVSRLYVQRNELQTGTDAAALAAALQLTRDSVSEGDSAVSVGARNRVLTRAGGIAKADVICGTWNTATRVFSTDAASGRCGTSTSAVQVTGKDSTQYLFQAMLNSGMRQVTTIAVAWAAPILGTSCIRPWAIPYSELTTRLDPTNPDPNRDLTANDIRLLATLPRSALQFNLKVGSPPGTPGNFGAVDITGVGANNYRSDIGTCSTVVLGPGDVIYTETGNMVGPTLQGAAVLCKPLYGSGACGDGRGGIGLTIKAPLFIATGPLNGKKPITIKMIGSFSLDSVLSNASVSGHFLRATDDGTIGTTPSTLFRIVLVQ